MNLYFKLLKLPVFRIRDVNQYYGNLNSARSAIKRLMGSGMVCKIRNDLYTCINGETDTPVANRFQIASNITATSYISHHTAFEYYGITDQIFYDVYVSSVSAFNDFDFDGYHYRHIVSKNQEGIERAEYNGGIVATDMERTVIDSIKDLDKIAGIEETIQALENIRHLKEDRLLRYMEIYHNQFLYQKAGFLLSKYRDRLNLSAEFFNLCKVHVGKSKRYLTKDSVNGQYSAEWKLVIPDDLYFMKNGVIADADL